MYDLEFKIKKFNKENEEIWDYFVLNSSVNGTFLHTRKFLNYHKSKFIDSSYLIYNDNEEIIAVCPACELYDNNRKVLFSHKGSTFGGLVINNNYYDLQNVLKIINLLEKKLIEDDFTKIYLKITPSLFSKESSDLLDFCLKYNNYLNYSDLNLYIDFNNYNNDILSNIKQGKRGNIKNCIKNNFNLKRLDNDKEIIEFYNILCITLNKYQAKPVHNINELLDFKNYRLKDECEFFGIYNYDKMIAGSMMFYFNNIKCAHTQYLCSLPEYNKLSPMTFMYYCMIIEAKQKNYQKLSWGIVTENDGKFINLGLAKSKLSYGSKYSINTIYYKNLI